MTDIAARPSQPGRERTFSGPATRRLHSSEEPRGKLTRKILDAAYTEARTLLHKHRQALEQTARGFLHREMMDAATFKHVLEHIESAEAA